VTNVGTAAMNMRKSFGRRETGRWSKTLQVQKQEAQRVRKAPERKQEPRPSIIRKDIGATSVWDLLKRLLKIGD
jgi:hypothetical protein